MAQTKGNIGCSSPVLLVSCGVQGPQVQDKETSLLPQVGSSRSFRIPFLQLPDLAHVTSLSTCAPLASPAQFLASVAAVKSLHFLQPHWHLILWATVPTSAERNVPSLVYSTDGEISTTPEPHGKWWVWRPSGQDEGSSHSKLLCWLRNSPGNVFSMS